MSHNLDQGYHRADLYGVPNPDLTWLYFMTAAPELT